MASESNSVWAIDIGNCTLKALHLVNDGGTVKVAGFDHIRHGKILNGGGVKEAERDELIALSLRQFVTQNDLSKSDVIVSVPSQNSFARFVTLPPVEEKRIPEIVKFEAAQQIPFDINDVQWDWQMMSGGDSSEMQVGIFAIKNEIVSNVLEHYSRENVQIKYVQMAPMALYNYALYDLDVVSKSSKQATVIIDIGAENTDLVVCTKTTVWQRCIPMGGNAFTRAISDAFKLNFEKAEKLKRTAAMSKYARQVFQAMRPVFTDLASEIQRSLGFYSSSNPHTKLSKVVALGGGTKMRGLLKYLQQTLQIAIEKPDSFSKVAMGTGVSAAQFHENVSDFGVVYGLAIQGLGLARIESNLLPRSVARSMAWAAKAKYFTAVASVLLAVSLAALARTNFDAIMYRNNKQVRQKISGVINAANQAKRKLQAEENKAPEFEARIQKAFEPLRYRDVIPQLHQTIISVLPNAKNNPAQKELYEAFARDDVRKVLRIPRKQRKQIFVTEMSVYFADDVGSAEFGSREFFKGGGKKKTLGEEDDDDDMGLESSSSSKFRPRPTSTGDDDTMDVGEQKAGFIVSISGYCPYANIGELMDPVGVENDRSRWGVITRLLHLEEIFDGNSPFVLYKKTDIDHFRLEIGEVSLEAEMPRGIGSLDIRKNSKGIASKYYLIDPLTKEIIEKIAVLDEYGREKIDRVGNVVYEINDHWFRLDMKFIWKDAPAVVEVDE